MISISTGNDIMNALTGGGYSECRLYLLLIDNQIKHKIDKLNIIPKEAVEKGQLFLQEEVRDWSTAWDIELDASTEGIPSIIINYFSNGFDVLGQCMEVVKISDQVILISKHTEDTVRFEILQSGFSVDHGLAYPYIYKEEV